MAQGHIYVATRKDQVQLTDAMCHARIEFKFNITPDCQGSQVYGCHKMTSQLYMPLHENNKHSREEFENL